jgi:putative flippase GtrA
MTVSPPTSLRQRLLYPSRSSLIQFIRYGCVGAVAFLFDFGTLWAATTWLGLHYLISALLGFCVGLLVNYWLATRWVFEKRKHDNASVQFALFALVGIVGVGLNELSMWSLTEWVGLHYLGSKLGSAILVYLWNFSIRKALLF